VALLEAGLVCTCVRIEAETEHGDRLSRIWRHHVAFSPAAVAERVRWQLEGWDITEGLTLLRLVPEDVEEDRGRQRGFWGEATEADHRAARGLARVQGLLGPDAVVTAALGGGRGPRERVELIPWGSPLPPPASGKEIPTWPGRVPSPSPVLVPADPIPAVVLDAGGDAVGVTGRSFITAPPARLSIDSGPWEEIRSWAGPWTADERWWDPPVHRRSARLQVVLARGTAHLITLHAGRWWIEGTYD
jgi:protein ImuB